MTGSEVHRKPLLTAALLVVVALVPAFAAEPGS